jgi:hypothetical protein
MSTLALNRLACIFVLSASVLATGCATKFEKQSFNSEASANIKKITVPHWNDQDEYKAIVVNHPGLSFGLIGAAIAAADTATKTKQFNAVLNPDKTRLTEAFYGKALPSLKQLGYDVIAVPAKRIDKSEDVKESVRKAQGQDASLLLDFNAAYLAAGASTDYYPSVTLVAELTDTKSQATLYREAYHYGYNNGDKNVVHLEAAADCKFQDITALTADIEKTRVCLTASIDILVEQIVADLKK